MSVSDAEEREANYFAMCLLMPESFVRAEMKKIGAIDIVDGTGIEKLARKFKVSAPLMTLRIGQLGLGIEQRTALSPASANEGKTS